MRIGILSRNRELYSTRRLCQAAEDRGHQVSVVDYLRCYLNITSHRPRVLYGGRELDFDAVIPRIGASHTYYGAAVVRQFEMQGVYSANDSEAVVRSRDKLRAMQLLAGAGLGLPVTGFAHSPKDVPRLIEDVGGAPLVVKLLEGTQGNGVVLAESGQAAESVVSAFRQLDADILVQEFIEEAEGADLRAFVVGGRVIAAMRRQGPAGDFRSNLHRGGTAHRVQLTAQERSLAQRSAKVLGLNIAGVDIIRSHGGPLVVEVNSSPGLEGIESASDRDVAGRIIDFVQHHSRRGKIRDRLNA
ncbi:MAG: 30S ribosomal protein S6--L-glutamate ligase [Acidobacteriota bacterium]